MNQSKLEERLKKIDMLFKAKKLDIEASKPLETIQAKPINFEEEKKPEMLPAVQPVKQDQKYIIKPNPDHNIPSVSKKIQKPKSADPKEIRDQKKKEQLQAFIKKRDEERKCRTLRKCGGVIWQDDTIDDWPENDFRIFCGDLGNEVTDEIQCPQIQ